MWLVERAWGQHGWVNAANRTRMRPTWVDMAGQRGSTRLTERAWVRHGLTWPLTLALPCEWKGEPRGIEIQARSVTYLMSLPLLGSSLIISDPSVAAYDFLSWPLSPEDVWCPCDVAKFRRALDVPQ